MGAAQTPMPSILQTVQKAQPHVPKSHLSLLSAAKYCRHVALNNNKKSNRALGIHVRAAFFFVLPYHGLLALRRREKDEQKTKRRMLSRKSYDPRHFRASLASQNSNT